LRIGDIGRNADALRAEPILEIVCQPTCGCLVKIDNRD
jgi:hypothetical protein